MAKKISQNKKKIDWKKVLTLVVIVALIVLKLLYGSDDGREDVDDQSTSLSVVEGSQSAVEIVIPEQEIPDLSFRSEYLLNQHYEKHGIDMGFASPEEYETAACMVIANPDALHKTEAEDGDDVYYLESTNEIVMVSKDGYIRTYFWPEDGIDYFNRQ